MPSYEEAKNILQTATDGGIVSFDTAKGYGKSEEVLGKFFKNSLAEKTLITKVEFDKESANEIKDSLFLKIKDSINVMGLEKLPLVLLHSEEYLKTYGKALTDALKELKAEGLADSVGISFSDKADLIALTNPDIFDSVQIPANMFDNAEIRNGKIKALSDCGITVYARSIYLQGLFFKDTKSLPEKLKSAEGAINKLKNLSDENNISMAALAVSYMRSVKGITSLVLGCETVSQLLESLSLFDTAPLNNDIISKINEISEEIDPIVIRPWEWNK